MTQQVRWFAGAAHAAGLEEEALDGPVPEGASVRTVLAERHPGAATVLQRCSFLADGKRLDGDAPWPPDAAVLDVLPPFTGG